MFPFLSLDFITPYNGLHINSIPKTAVKSNVTLMNIAGIYKGRNTGMEQKRESDMTKKEKRQLEIRKLKAMSTGGKIEYIWMYYKAWFAAALLAAAAVYLGAAMYQGSRANVAVSVVIVGGNAQDTDKLEREIKEYLHANEKHDTVRIQANISGEDDTSASETALTTLIGANSVDVLICPEEVYVRYKEQGGFDGDALVLANEGAIKELVDVRYDEIYAGIPVNAQHKQAAQKVLELINDIDNIWK